MVFMLSLRGIMYETHKKNVTKFACQNHRDSDCSWHDFYRIRRRLLEMKNPPETLP
jgi:hypothetical protein